MATSNKDLMTQAREALSGRWALAVGTFFVYMLIVIALTNNQFLFRWSGVIGSIAGNITIGSSLLFLLVGGALSLGVSTFALAIARKEEADFNMLFSGFKYYSKTLGLFLLIVLYVLLWMLLLLIPGFIAALSYSQAFFLMSDDPNIGAMEAIDKSKKMMNGHKRKLFCLYLRFFGWFILGILSLGIGFLWIIPYVNISTANFYEDIKGNFTE